MAFATFIKTFLALGDEFIFRVSQLCCLLGGEGCELEGPGDAGAFDVARHR